MPVAPPINTERRQQSCELIAKLHNERQEVLSLYCNFVELKPFSANDAVKNLLTQFSQILVDYVSLGHFGVYERLLAGTERRSWVLSIAKEIYPEFKDNFQDTLLSQKWPVGTLPTAVRRGWCPTARWET